MQEHLDKPLGSAERLLNSTLQYRANLLHSVVLGAQDSNLRDRPEFKKCRREKICTRGQRPFWRTLELQQLERRRRSITHTTLHDATDGHSDALIALLVRLFVKLQPFRRRFRELRTDLNDI